MGKGRTWWRDGRQEAQEVEVGQRLGRKVSCEGGMEAAQRQENGGEKDATRRKERALRSGGRGSGTEVEGVCPKRRRIWGAWQMRTEVAVAKGVVQDRPPARVGLEQLPAAAVVRVSLRVGKLEHPLSHHLDTHTKHNSDHNSKRIDTLATRV